MIIDAEVLLDHPLQIDEAPAYHAIDGAVGAVLDEGRQGGELISRKPRRMALRADILLPLGPCSLNRWTQSRSVWRSLLPIRAACSRSMPSRTAANDKSRRFWLACLEPAHRSRHGANPPASMESAKPTLEKPS